MTLAKADRFISTLLEHVRMRRGAIAAGIA